MTEVYRLRFKTSDYEVELEASDKAYIDSKLDELVKQADSLALRKKKRSNQPHQSKQPLFDANTVVERISQFERYSELSRNVIRRQAVVPRLLMALFFVKDDESPWLSGSQIEAITDQLGAKVGAGNVTRSVRNYPSLFEMDGVPRQGVLTKYKISKKGVQAFERVLNGGELTV